MFEEGLHYFFERSVEMLVTGYSSTFKNYIRILIVTFQTMGPSQPASDSDICSTAADID